MARLTKAKREERDEACERLRALLPPGSTVYTVLRNRARSGMSRDISIHAIVDGEPTWLTYNVALATGLRFDPKWEAIKMGGCGMDMGFAIVSALGHALYPEGFGCTGRGEHPDMCPSNDHSNGDRDYTPGHWHKSGDYAFRHRWL